MSKSPTHELHGACLVPTTENQARMNETDAAAYQPGPVFRTRMHKGRAQCEECGEWLDNCRCVDYVPERRRRESLSSRLAALEAENEQLKKALAPFARAATQLHNGAHDLSVLIVPVDDPPYKQRTVTATVGDLRRARAVWEKETNGDQAR